MAVTILLLVLYLMTALPSTESVAYISVAVFMAPLPFEGQSRIPQIRAIESFLSSMPKEANVYLLGNHPSFYAIANELGNRVFVDASLDCNSCGTPLFNGMLKKMSEAKENYTVLLSSAAAFGEVAANLLQFLEGNREKIVLIASDYVAGRHLRIGGVPDVGFWMWNTRLNIFCNFSVPPFAYQRGRCDNWLTSNLLSCQLARLVDVSDLFPPKMSKHERNETKRRNFMAETEQASTVSTVELKVKRWNDHRRRPWESILNNHLASYLKCNCSEIDCSTNRAVQKLVPCDGRSGLCVVETNCTSEPNEWLCNFARDSKPVERQVDAFDSNSFPSLYGRFDEALRQSSVKRVVILTSVTYGYKKFLMNFICNLRRMEIQNPLIVALDVKIFQFAAEQGLNVFLDQSTVKTAESSGNVCAYGTACFKKVTKMKSKLVLKALKLQYHVLWSDVDVVWFKNPILALLKYGPGVFPIQSDSPYDFESPNSNLNSGFYFARSEPMVINAFQAIVKLAEYSNGTEQPCFRKVLCEDGNSTIGDNECIFPGNGLKVVTLPRNLFPNGKFNGYFNLSNLCQNDGCYIIHNNWVTREEKTLRLFGHKLWFFDEGMRVCLYQ